MQYSAKFVALVASWGILADAWGSHGRVDDDTVGYTGKNTDKIPRDKFRVTISHVYSKGDGRPAEEEVSGVRISVDRAQSAALGADSPLDRHQVLLEKEDRDTHKIQAPFLPFELGVQIGHPLWKMDRMSYTDAANGIVIDYADVHAQMKYDKRCKMGAGYRDSNAVARCKGLPGWGCGLVWHCDLPVDGEHPLHPSAEAERMGASVPNLNEVGVKAEHPLAETLRRDVANLLQRNTLHFPGAQPISFARHHVSELQLRDYFVCEKSDGVRCLLLLTADRNGEGADMELVYLIDRKNDYYFVPGLHFPSQREGPDDFESFHRDTILDGELLFDTYPDGRKVLKFLVFDCLAIDGQLLMQRTLDKRLAYFMERVYKPYDRLQRKFPDDCKGFAFTLEKKNFEFSYGIEKMFREVLPKLPHGNDGLIFTCKDTPYKFGTDEHILKWKPAEENTIDFRLGLEWPPLPGDDDADAAAAALADSSAPTADPDYDAVPRFDLYVSHGRDDSRPWARMHADADDWQRMKAWSLERGDGLDGQVVECRIDGEGRWRFMRFRDDKLDANHISTVEKVVESINDSVDRGELTAAAPTIRSAWKRREAASRP
ncbi:hypothetical protein FH972_023466 [Carpinus fangiana]|uniref:mRNA-capping enzyme subunit alpha n=1 Tax=Carpinus fangiana TaxID=176857 RepID=A0A5N6KVS7_9ROSI|nr:hypothetical protein FH972_023466 [Carpinus fangiana]